MLKTNLLGNDISLLGMGAMRLPIKDDAIDKIEVDSMIDYALANGVNYFDTSVIYHDGFSELSLRESLVKRHDRNSFYLADKMSWWILKDGFGYQECFNKQLQSCGVDYFDFYLLHSLDKSRVSPIEKDGGFEFMKKLKAEGKAKHIGFSFHDAPELLEEILKNHPEMEFVQLQINYLDWDMIKAKECYEIARKYNKPIIIMEPVKGGTLVKLPEICENILKETSPNNSIVSWAFRFSSTLDGIMCVLSGMSNSEQLKENISIFNEMNPLSKDEQVALENALLELAKISSIPCTACKYCIDCPEKINIPAIFGMYNQFKRNVSDGWNQMMSYSNTLDVKADACVACGKCERHCPQSIKIIENLKICHKELSE